MANEMPHTQFPADWQVRRLPPFAGAMARYKVTLPSGRMKSVYADFNDRLGFMGEPYWEVYPYHKDEIGYCDIQDVDKLLEMIAYDSRGKGRGTKCRVSVE